MKSYLTFSRWLLLLTMGLFLFGSSGNLFAQNDASKQAEIEALHGPTVEVPQSDGRAVGDNCTTPIVVNIPADLPYADMGNTTCGRGNTYQDSDLGWYDGGEDIIYELNVTAETEVTITMDPKTTTYSGLGLFTSCPTGPLGAGNFWISTGSSASPRSLQRTLAPGTYYVMADTWASPDCIPVLDMTIAEVLPPATVTVFPFIESFEVASTTVADWRQIQEAGSALWTFAAGSSGGAITTAFDGTRNARFVSSGSTPKTKLVSPPLDLSATPVARVSFYLGQEDWFGDQNTTAVYYRISEADPWVLIQNFTNNINAWTMFDLELPNPSATYQVAFEGLDNFGRANVIDLVTVYEVLTPPGLEILNANLDMGDRPIGAWMKPAAFEIINNPGGGDFEITQADIDNNVGGFLQVVTPQLPYVLASGATTTEFGITNSAAAVADGLFNGSFAMFFGSRAVLTADYTGNAYTPVAGDVWEMAFDADAVAFPDNVAMGSFVNNYDLPGATADGWDAVYKIDVDAGDIIVDIDLTGTDAKMALYPADFDGVGGPDTDNALVSATTTATGLELFEGVYYLVVSTTGADFILDYTPTAMPASDAVTNLTPADGAVNIINGSNLTWSWGANTMDYRVVLGTTYPPATVVKDWATANTAVNGSYTLSGLNPNLQYFWRIDTRNNNGTTSGEVWGFTTTITPPSALAATVNDPGESSTTVSASLTWTGPTNRAFVGYNVYRDGVKITSTPVANASFTDLGLARNTAYSYYVTSVYDEGESAASNTANIATKGVGTANGFVYDALSNEPLEGASVRIQGTNGTYALVTDETGAYASQVYAGLYNYTVSAADFNSQTLSGQTVLHGGTLTNDFYLTESPYPVADVVAFELDEDKVQVSWGGSTPPPPPPLIEEWLAYDNNGIPTQYWWAGAGAPFSWAISFDPTDLEDLAGASLTKIAIFNTAAPDVNTLNIYEGDLEAGTATVVHTQDLTGLTLEDWNEVELTVPVPIDVTKQLWVSMYSASPTGGTAASTPGLNMKGDWINFSGSWIHMSTGTGNNVTWSLRAFATNASNRSVTQLVSKYTEPRYNTNASAALASTQIENAKAFRPEYSSRGIADYTVWREKVYQAGTLEEIGNTSQLDFVDFDWGTMDWGVYRWAVTANYDGGQVSIPTFSNVLDKDMEVAVDVAVTLNSAEAPGGTSVTFANMSEPDLELVYNTILDNSGTFAWDAFRRGTYDIEVMLPGYGIVEELGVDIFDDASFTWLLEELLSSPSNLYVTPTAFATWDIGGGGGGGAFTPFLESFDGLLNGELPVGWTSSPVTTNWGVRETTNNAGGTAPEMRFNWSPSGTDAFYLMTPMMSTEGQSSLQLTFKQYINDFNSNYTMRVVAIADGVEYIIEEWLDPSILPDITPMDMSYVLNA
ncbi:MAG: carboxypeptidase regulatory-like domain-containing protein, partial [Bacteroidales bacterium]|nr:carboxypeptidase regulatory-like domain-containing protein [Bacteroidales bacterium]